MSQLDVIILTNTKNIHFFEMTKKCIESYLLEGNVYINKIILMETNQSWDLTSWSKISSKVHSICPNIPFNYNRFLNKALSVCSAPIICLSNNDVVVQTNCINNIIKAFNEDSDLMSASPIDRTWHRNSYKDFPEENFKYIGYETTKFILGFNIYLRKQVYDVIGLHDERFDFYYQDNDYEMCLKKNKLKHALISNAHIVHGHNKPDTETTEQETLNRLEEDRIKFVNKWQFLFNSSMFNKYLKLGILCKNQTLIGYTNDLVNIATNFNDIKHCHYYFECSVPLTEQLINKILLTIDKTSADKIILDEQNTVIKL